MKWKSNFEGNYQGQTINNVPDGFGIWLINGRDWLNIGFWEQGKLKHKWREISNSEYQHFETNNEQQKGMFS